MHCACSKVLRKVVTESRRSLLASISPPLSSRTSAHRSAALLPPFITVVTVSSRSTVTDPVQIYTRGWSTEFPCLLLASMSPLARSPRGVPLCCHHHRRVIRPDPDPTQPNAGVVKGDKLASSPVSSTRSRAIWTSCRDSGARGTVMGGQHTHENVHSGRS